MTTPATSTWLYVTTPRITGAIEVCNDIIRTTPPIWWCWRGRPVHDFLAAVVRPGCRVVRLSAEEHEETP